MPAFPFTRGEWYGKAPPRGNDADDAALMTASRRKLLGTVLLIALVVAYPLAAMMVYVSAVPAAPWWGAILYALIAGLGWALPAAMIIRWMARP